MQKLSVQVHCSYNTQCAQSFLMKSLMIPLLMFPQSCFIWAQKNWLFLSVALNSFPYITRHSQKLPFFIPLSIICDLYIITFDIHLNRRFEAIFIIISDKKKGLKSLLQCIAKKFHSRCVFETWLYAGGNGGKGMQRDPNVFDTAGRDVSAAGLLPVELELFIKPPLILSIWNSRISCLPRQF